METRLQSSEVRIPKIENNFEFTTTVQPCPYFQSSYARSLLFNTNQSQSLDFELSFRIGQNSDTNDSTIDENVSRSTTPPPPLPDTAPPPLSSSTDPTTVPAVKHLIDDEEPLSLPLSINKKFNSQIKSATTKRRYATSNGNQVKIYIY